ncbi:LytR family transcriptional attenuator [Mobilisporobacter senegalensis]|uniref:LytR family transcriptional attenuator n=1 Tax=Mobilisporobacter senegalensis TaxID=1329262 RepID=A0A3N1XVZ4_9FIRM|nr:LCP family protein [Mobilisporobacter senegalensis]ROR29352.1 LytR family transcriptional attenuator [Mobilisporobacter senegalensis]
MDNDKNIESTFDDELMQELSESLAKQISTEMDDDADKSKNNPSDDETSENKKRPKWVKITAITGGALVSVILILFIVVNAFLGRINFTDWGNTKNQEEEFEKGEGNGEEIDPDSVQWGPNGSLRQDKNTVNVLLVGEEAINEGGARGRTDSIMIATMNVKQKAIKLTSLMRDMYVQIPGYSDNKLNAAYHTGGMPLLKETIQLNFDIELDGAVLVDFDGFESIIDKLGGVEITLTDSEARYLNTTNYISNPANRNVKTGTQTLNGNQALGYSRVRYRKASSGEADDFGRTSRQRTVLNAIFEKYKSKNVAELVLLLNDILPLVTTDIPKSDIVGYLGTFVTLGTTKLETLRVPIDNGYTTANIRSMDVLLPNMPANIEALHTFIFGSTNVSSSTPDFEEDDSNVSKSTSKLEFNTANP